MYICIYIYTYTHTHCPAIKHDRLGNQQKVQWNCSGNHRTMWGMLRKAIELISGGCRNLRKINLNKKRGDHYCAQGLEYYRMTRNISKPYECLLLKDDPRHTTKSRTGIRWSKKKVSISNTWEFPKRGTPDPSNFTRFSIIDHPAIGVPTWLWKPPHDSVLFSGSITHPICWVIIWQKEHLKQ